MIHSYDSTRQCFRDCVICETPQLEGINVLKSFICHTCEQQLLVTDAEEVVYMMYVSKLRPLQTYLKKQISGAVQR